MKSEKEKNKTSAVDGEFNAAEKQDANFDAVRAENAEAGVLSCPENGHSGETPQGQAEIGCLSNGRISRAKRGRKARGQTEAKKYNQTPCGEKILTKKQQRARTALRWFLMNAGVLMMAASVYFFQVPNNFTLGGVGGISIILSQYITPLVPFLTQAVIMAIINVFLLVLGLVLLGKQCTLRTIYCSLMYTFEIWLFEFFDLVPKGTSLTSEPFLELVYAILLFGVGGALIFNCGASSGGTDIIALILKKFTSLNVGMALMLVDFVVVCVSFYTFTVTDALFSLIGLFTKSFLLDSVIENIGKTKCITIITTKPELISEYILNVINHGYTSYDAEGGYTGEKKKVLVTICKRSEAFRLKSKLHEVDPTAFVIITDANEILGKGFGGTI